MSVFADGLVIVGAVFVVPALAVMGAYAGYQAAVRVFGPIVVLTVRDGRLTGHASQKYEGAAE